MNKSMPVNFLTGFMPTVYRGEDKETRRGNKKARIISDPGFLLAVEPS